MPSPRRKFDKYFSKGIEFYFKYDDVAPELLHIYARHLTTPSEAIETYFHGKTTWNERYKRFETVSATHGLFWLWLDENSKVLVISCFRN
jgi:hypothetical protein